MMRMCSKISQLHYNKRKYIIQKAKKEKACFIRCSFSHANLFVIILQIAITMIGVNYCCNAEMTEFLKTHKHQLVFVTERLL